MKIENFWNQPGGGITALPPFSVNPNDPHKDDVELQIAKAKAASQAFVHQQFDSTPPLDRFSAKVIKE
jgi:hypothetical protein